jgi:hypothetical protein
VDQAERPLRAPESRSLTLRLLGGLLLVISTASCGPAARTGHGRGKGGCGIYPELAAFGIADGVSPALSREVGRLTALLPS